LNSQKRKRAFPIKEQYKQNDCIIRMSLKGYLGNLALGSRSMDRKRKLKPMHESLQVLF
jgi:hypothetical protein